MEWSEEQVIALSPDDSSAKSGKDLARTDKWVSLSKDENALWGECKGSGSKPYQTQIDLNNIAFKCSCPSRKFPCKHGIALLLLYSKNAGNFKETEQPAWVTEWLSKRQQREEKKTEKKEKPVDEKAQAKRQEARQLKVGDGIEELTLWIKDIVRNGILNMSEKPLSYWENMAKRLIDAQAPGLARMVQALGNTDFYTENWQSIFLNQLLRIYLVTQGFQRIDTLSPALQGDLKSYIGFAQSQEDLKEQTGTTDTWLVLAKQTTEDENLTAERYWLYGNNSKQYALLLQFLVRGQGKTIALTPGMSVQAELVFYPSIAPLRALVKRQVGADTIVVAEGLANWSALAAEETRIYSLVPFTSERPFVVNNLRPVLYQDKWWLEDADGRLMPIKKSFKNIYRLLAISGGKAFKIAVIGSEQQYEPVGLWNEQNTYYIL